MMKAACLAIGLCAVAVPARAQQMQWTDKGFAAVDAGFQVGSHDLTTQPDLTLYEETITRGLQTSQKVKSGGLIDMRAGYRVWHNVTAGLGYSYTSSKANGTITASVPDPIKFDNPRTVNASANGLKHSESALHFSATWMMPVTDKVDVGFSFGPTIFFVKQDIATGLTVTEPVPTVNTVLVDAQKKTTVGINLGVDATYMLNKRYGVGGLARYTWGSAKLPGADLTVGGLQLGGGLRYRF
jgi:hypothetical protein